MNVQSGKWLHCCLAIDEDTGEIAVIWAYNVKKLFPGPVPDLLTKQDVALLGDLQYAKAVKEHEEYLATKPHTTPTSTKPLPDINDLMAKLLS